MQRKNSLFFPLVLIAAGLLWIMVQMRIIQPASFWALAYLWPFLLIAAGLGLILRSYWIYSKFVVDILVVGGAFLAVFFAPQLGWTHAPTYMFGSSGFFVGSSERGSGHIVSERRGVQDFTAVRLSYPAEVIITQGGAESLTIVADDNVAASIRTRVVDGVLEISNLHDRFWTISPTRTPKITIVVKDLAQVDFQSAGELQLIGLKTENLKLIMEGAGSLKLDNIQLQTLDCNLNGVGSVEASGTSNSMNVHVQGLGSFDGSNLHSQTANVNLDGMGSATVWADKDLTAEVGGLGSVNYYGDAQVTKTIDGLGTVQFKGTK
jgi:Putative auto-transporter adhesin, head GIN domain